MFLSSYFLLALASGIAYASPAAIAPSQPLITPPPLIPRALSSYFIGYAMYDDGSVETYTCPSSISSDTFTISSSKYAGCAFYASDIATACYQNSIVYAGNAYPCSSYCATNLIFTSVGDLYPASFIACGTRPAGLKVLHVSKEDLPTGAAAVSFATVETTRFVTVTPTQSTTSVPIVSSTIFSSPTPSPTNTSIPHKNNGPIIGGAVAGALIFVGLIGAGAFFFFSKRRAAASSTPYQGPDQPVAMSPAPAPPQVPYSPPPAYGQPVSAPILGAESAKQAQVAAYSVPEMAHHEVHGQSAPISIAPMPVCNQNVQGGMGPDANRRSELA